MTEGGLGSSPRAGGAPRIVGRTGSVAPTCPRGTSVGASLVSQRFAWWMCSTAVLLCSVGDRFLLEATNTSECREAIFKQRKH